MILAWDSPFKDKGLSLLLKTTIFPYHFLKLKIC